MRLLRSDIAAGKSTFFVIAGEHGTIYVRAEYLAIEPPRRIVYAQQFVDEREHLAPAPGAAVRSVVGRTLSGLASAIDRCVSPAHPAGALAQKATAHASFAAPWRVPTRPSVCSPSGTAPTRGCRY